MTVGTICYSVMISLGEMIAYLPIPGGHITLAERFVDSSFSFALGWNYWYHYIIVVPTEINGASLLINFWDKHQKINSAVWITIGIAVVIAINLMGAGIYGEAEFIFASIKVITIVVLIILGIVLDLGGGPDHDRIGFRYWINPGPFVQFDGIPGAKGQFLGFWAVLPQAAFAFIGTEIISIAAGETKDPRRNLPKAIRGVYIRILLFYIGGTIIIGLLVQSNNQDLLLTGTAGSSPFIIAIQRANIYGLPSVINACFITSALSAASSQLFASSRAIYGLAVSGNAPRIFLKTLPNGLPIVAVLFNSCFTLLSYISVQPGSSSGQVFTYFYQMASIAGLLNWFGIVVTYLRFYKGMKAQGYLRGELPYYSRFQPFAAWYAVCGISFILLLSGWVVFLKDHWVTSTFVTNYLALVLFPILYFGARIYYQEGSKKPHEMDFVTNIAEIEAETYDETSGNVASAFWKWCGVRGTKRGTTRNDKMRLSTMRREHEYEMINAERREREREPVGLPDYK